MKQVIEAIVLTSNFHHVNHGMEHSYYGKLIRWAVSEQALTSTSPN